MNGRIWLWFIFLLTSCKVTPPNIVFILVDDLGWVDLGCYGSTFHDTPNLDQLAREGLLFTDAYAASPVCSPTRAAIMTGKHPARINITDWIPGMSADRAINPSLEAPMDLHNLPRSEKTMAEHFQEQGYRTFFAGKWHLGETEQHWPKNHGFEINIGGNSWGSPGRFNSENGYYSPYGNPQLIDGPAGEYLTDRLTDESIKFISNQRSNPFFVFLSYYTVHTPIAGCKKYDDYYFAKKLTLADSGKIQSAPEHSGVTRINQTNAKYAAMVRSLDENVGKLISHLKEYGLLEKTIVVFTSDNGGLSTLRRPGPTSVRPLRAGKGWCYEGGIRVPLIIRYPRRLKNTGPCNQPVCSMDLYPTLLDLSGLNLDTSQHKDGTSILPLIDNKQDHERSLIWHYPHYHGSTWRPGSAIRQGRWKLIRFYEEDRIELYDLSKDIGEQENLCSARPKICASLQGELTKELNLMDAKFPRPLQEITNER